jgi:SpoVK/Ycf46/Vps4 family AAA+-type ATPase
MPSSARDDWSATSMCLHRMKRAAGRSLTFISAVRPAAILAKDLDIELLVKQTEGYVGADIEALVREAKMAAMRDFITRMGTLGTSRNGRKRSGV